MPHSLASSISRTPRLGHLELEVIARLWQLGTADVAAMQRAVGDPRGLSRNTIHSTLERLVRKRLAARRKLGRAYEYRPAITRADWIARAIGDLLGSLPGTEPSAALASFVDLAARAGDGCLDELEQLVRARRRARAEPR
jgi:predicted transcriptional regulator